MLEKILKFLFGSESKRFHMTFVYLGVYLTLTFSGHMDAVAFATFSGVFGAWIVADTVRK